MRRFNSFLLLLILVSSLHFAWSSRGNNVNKNNKISSSGNVSNNNEATFRHRVISVLAKFLERHKLRHNSSDIVKSGYVVFNCSSPSYLNEQHRSISLQDTELNRNRVGLGSRVNTDQTLCDLRTNIWKSKSTNRLLTYDPKERHFGQVANDRELARLLRLDSNQQQLDADLASQLNNASLVASVLKTFHHPRFY